MVVELESSHGSQAYASVTFDDITTEWRQYTATLTADATDTTARLAVKLQVLLFSHHLTSLHLSSVHNLTPLKPRHSSWLQSKLCLHILPQLSSSARFHEALEALKAQRLLLSMQG